VTTYDLASGRIAAIPAGSLRSRFAARLFGCVLLLGVALPVCAQQAVPALVETGSLAAANPTAAPLSAPAISDEVQLPGRANLFVASGRPPVQQPNDATAAAAAPTGRIQSLIQHALALLGTPYRWGGTGTDGFDCSGLVGYVFRSALGIELPRVSTQMANSGQLITDRANLSPGDLVFFGTHHGKRVDHVGIYVGDGRFLHAPRTGRDVTVSSLESGYWSDKYMEARRVAGL
jgi:cell wall-associated NlpC family hydrolase